MRTLLLPTAFCCGLALLQPASAQEKQAPVKWEYAELVYRTVTGVGDDGKPIAATRIHWSSGAGEISVRGWDELAEKLKAPFKKEGANPKIQMLNALGAEGWELVSRHDGPASATLTSATLTFKRRVP